MRKFKLINMDIPKSININEKLSLFTEHYSPRIIASLNDNHVKLAKLKGDFVWHVHNDADEMFLVIKGTLDIEFRNGTVCLNEGEMLVIPKGIEHKPVAKEECSVMLIEPAGTINTGDNSDGSIGEWI